MMHLKAKRDLWIYSVYTSEGTIIVVELNEYHRDYWLAPVENSWYLYLHSGDTLTFKAIADGTDPYAQLATRYPEWFEIVP